MSGFEFIVGDENDAVEWGPPAEPAKKRPAHIRAKPCSTCSSLQANCRCQRMKAKYGISGVEYNRMRDAQDRRCAICNMEMPSTKLVVDHCHTTGAVRGLLCTQCNSGLGMFKDSMVSLRSAIVYLAKFKEDVCHYEPRNLLYDDELDGDGLAD